MDQRLRKKEYVSDFERCGRAEGRTGELMESYVDLVE